MSTDSDKRERDPIATIGTASSTNWYVDGVFLVLALGAFVVLGIQTLHRDEPATFMPVSIPLIGDEAVNHFGGRVSLVSTAPSTFVIRADGTRFEPGATLPSGAVLARIRDTHLALLDSDREVVVTLP